MAKQILGQGVWYDGDAKGYIALDITENMTPLPLQVFEGVELLPKNEYHCSLVATRDYIADEAREQEIADAVRDFLQTHKLHFVSLGEERYICRKEGQMTMIGSVEIDGVDELREFVQALIPDYKPPLCHVTLLKSEATEYGIGINSAEDLERYCVAYSS
ncbi:MAG TPA: hypothetical protein VK497_03345 [Candidatus Saccharimonadales bacterium]|nr:hypothetical protein [Candidatus Saccharimonadales bacterium]